MSSIAPRVPTWNVANQVTVLRLVLVPVFAWLLLHDDGASAPWRVAAAAAFVLAALTDRVDGHLARSRGLVTRFGTAVDPLADKALTGAALVGLSLLGELPWLVTAAVLVREVGVSLLRLWVVRHGTMPVSRGGKWKTALQGVAITLYVLPLTGAAASGRAVVMTAAVAVTLATGVDYVVRALALRRSSERSASKRARREAA